MQNTQRNEKQTTSLKAEVAELKRTVKNLEALVEANATTIATLATANIVDDIKVEFSDPNELKEMQKE